MPKRHISYGHEKYHLIFRLKGNKGESLPRCQALVSFSSSLILATSLLMGSWILQRREHRICSALVSRKDNSWAVASLFQPWDLEPSERGHRGQTRRSGPYGPYSWEAAWQGVAWICGYHGTRPSMIGTASNPAYLSGDRTYMSDLRQRLAHLLWEIPKSRTSKSISSCPFLDQPRPTL